MTEREKERNVGGEEEAKQGMGIMKRKKTNKKSKRHKQTKKQKVAI